MAVAVGMAEGREELLGKKHKALVVENCEQSQLADPERNGDPERRATPQTKWQNDPFFTFLPPSVNHWTLVNLYPRIGGGRLTGSDL